MKKFKKFLLSVLSLALVAVLSIGGTLAYLKSEDSDVNVMTLGNVKIAQHEYERELNADGSYKTDTIDEQTSYVLKNFTQAKPLLPIVGDPSTGAAGWDNTIVRMTQVNSYGSMQVFAGKVAQDKFVTVENTGKNDAYIRTLVAIEVGDANADLVGISYHQTWTKNVVGTFSANGTRYSLIEFTYNGAEGYRHEKGVLPAGDTSYPNLSQVYLKSAATNEDCEALDGNKNGLLDILVLSQAVQTSGFENAEAALNAGFGEVTVQNAAEWFTGMKLNVITKIDDTLFMQDDTIINLEEEGKNASYVQNNGKEVEFNGNGYTLTSGTSIDYGFIATGGNTIINNLDLNSLGGGIAAADGAKIELNNVDVDVDSESTSGRYNIYAVGEGTEVTINGGEYSFSPTKNQKRAYIYVGAGATVYVNGGTFGKASTRDGYKEGIKTDGTGKVIITGGTFGFDPSAWVASGYVATKTGSTWTVVAE